MLGPPRLAHASYPPPSTAATLTPQLRRRVGDLDATTRERLARDEVAVRLDGREVLGGHVEREHDPVADLQPGGLARVLDGADDVARVALGAQRVVEREVEHDERRRPGSTAAATARPRRRRRRSSARTPSGSSGDVAAASTTTCRRRRCQSPALRGLDDRLDAAAEPRARRARVDREPLRDAEPLGRAGVGGRRSVDAP